MKENAKILIFTALITLVLMESRAQSNQDFENRVSIVFGTSQLLIDGFNIEGNLFYKRFAFDYSHGVSLNFDNDILTGDAKTQMLDIHIPYSTGFGVGYRFTDWFNVRVEPKWHKFELYHKGDVQNNQNIITSYTTFSLGLGAYVNWLPFKKKDNFLKGITIAPSVRYWPKVSDSIDGSLTYQNRLTDSVETHKALEIGFGDTPFFVNVSVGYSISF